jgi:hypothetical protein
MGNWVKSDEFVRGILFGAVVDNFPASHGQKKQILLAPEILHRLFRAFQNFLQCGLHDGIQALCSGELLQNGTY